jgi:hypothetical protein
LSLLALFRTDGVSIYKIQGELLDGTAVGPSSEIAACLNQKFLYLAKGRQCFVFASEDGREVIKFLNYNRFYFPGWIASLPMPETWRHSLETYALRRQDRYRRTVDSLTLAFEKLPRQTGIDYLHLQEGGSLPTVEFLGPAGRVHSIDLNRVAFVLQKRADAAVFDRLEEIAKRQGTEGLNSAIAAILSHLEERCTLGIADDDRDIEINFGFLGDAPLLIDPGRLYLSQELKTSNGFAKEMNLATKKLRKWLLGHYPESAQFLSQQLLRTPVVDGLRKEDANCGDNANE